MRLSFLIFTSVLLSFISAEAPKGVFPIPDSVLTGYKLLDTRGFAKQLELDDKKSENLPWIITQCRLLYCHFEKAGPCSDLCVSSSPKVNVPIMQQRNRLMNKRQPDPSQIACEKECAIECGKTNCNEECAILCGHHWSYGNRKEYEAEYYQFMATLMAHALSKYNVTSVKN